MSDISEFGKKVNHNLLNCNSDNIVADSEADNSSIGDNLKLITDTLFEYEILPNRQSADQDKDIRFKK